MTHKNKRCWKCEKTCDGLAVQPGQSPNCDVMKKSEYDSLVDCKTKAFQRKMTEAIDEAFRTIALRQTEFMDEIKLDPRKTEIETTEVKISVQILKETDEQRQIRNGDDILNRSKGTEIYLASILIYVKYVC